MRTKPYRAVITALLALAALGAAGADRGHAQTQVAETPVVPDKGGKYPLGTPLTGPCLPTTRPSGSGRVTRTHTLTSFLHGEQPEDFAYEHPAYNHTQAIKPGGVYYEDRCLGLEGGPFNNPGVIGNGVPGFSPSDVGSWRMYPIRTATEYEYDDQDAMDWVAVGEHHEILQTVDFRTYDPCHFIATGVRGRVLKGRPGSRPVTVREGTIIAQGDTLTVQREGKTQGRALLRNDAGGNLGFGPGEYQFSDIEACNRYFGEGHHTGKLPEEPAQAEVKKGVLKQAWEDVKSIVRAGEDLYHDGHYSKLRHPRSSHGVEGPGRLKVIRRKGKTRSCALEGGLRVYTTSKGVPARKRELILEQGECAMTKDGRAPRPVR